MAIFRTFLFLLVIEVVLCGEEGLKVITKLPRNPLMKYHSYSSVMVLHFEIPENTAEASFKFKARDDSTSFIVRHCDPRNVSVYMKPGSYPVINPDGVSLPKTFLNISRPALHELNLQTDVRPKYINISSPTPGNWFAVSFISWTDPKKDRIEQQGLTSECEATLYAELSVVQKTNVVILASNTNTEATLESKPRLYKFFVPEDIDHILISVEVVRPCKLCDDLTLLVQSDSIPNEEKYQGKLVIDANNESRDYMWFWPKEAKWHYINITTHQKKPSKDFTEINIFLKYISGLQKPIPSNTTDFFKTSVRKRITVDKLIQHSIPYRQYNLLRLTAADSFIFEYDFRPNHNESVPLLLNITSEEMAILKFDVYDVIDIGGTLTVGLALKPEKAQKGGDKPQNYTIVACLRADVKEIPTFPDLCVYGNTSRKAPIILNNTSSGIPEYFHVPYPDPGTYYMSIRPFFGECNACNCSQYCEEKFDSCSVKCELNCTGTECENCWVDCEMEIAELEGCEGCVCDGNCAKTTNETEGRNVSTIFSISSHPCIAGKCGDYGKCNHYMSGGFIFSSCRCFGGYRGWDCSDSCEALSDSDILLALLLLTLSNLLFIPSIYFAYKRNYYTEAVAYFCSMFSSTFYHACDSKENQYGFCLFPLGVLQFCDFYCALLAIWVTLVAMAHTDRRVISIAHVAGAFVLAFGVTYNKHALWVYILPTVSGIILIGINWGLQCHRTRKLYPARRYLKLYMPVGAILVVMGLISFGFLETKENYKIVHSFWHVMMAVSLIFLLPNKQTFTFRLDT